MSLQIQRQLVANVVSGVRLALLSNQDIFTQVRSSNLVSDTVVLDAIETKSLRKDCKGARPRVWRTTFDFLIEDFSQKRGKVYSNAIRWKKEEWKLLVFPKGNASEGDVSFYLTVSGDEEQRSPDAIHFILTIVNQLDPCKSKSRELSHKFTRFENDWGYVSFIKYERVVCASEGFSVDDKVLFRVEFIDDERTPLAHSTAPANNNGNGNGNNTAIANANNNVGGDVPRGVRVNSRGAAQNESGLV